ncbi:hypothetical protein BHS09_21265 [Myxococcus xanthus]|uniref:Uncharacterized protein n=1 Tax=Myxococcus xanthus TaxID=34 RepID=A0AAE6G201_MYXXA|nr:hypothetical protein BHS09_21265 [Myxococcus xanthus]QDE76579.1 hypothetical protein BHS08_21280 [Myxococcus xanthus]
MERATRRTRTVLSLCLLALAGMARPGRAEEVVEEGPRLEIRKALQVRIDQGLSTPGAATVSLRRGRVGLHLTGSPWVRGGLEVSFDRLVLLPGPLQGPPLALHEASATFTVLPQRAWLSVGLFRPQVGRESLTSGFEVDSLDKAITQGPLREHLTGTESGRAPGVDVGGLLRGEGWSVRYDSGLVVYRPGPEGAWRPPLLVARAALTLGAPEAESYSLSLPMNDFGLRQGFTLALQGSTEPGGDARSWGVDALLRLRPLVLSAELHQVAFPQGHALLAHVRAGLNLPGPGATVLEPWALVARVTGGALADAPGGARLDAGLSWYLHRQTLRATLGGSWRPPGHGAASGQLGLSLQHRR